MQKFDKNNKNKMFSDRLFWIQVLFIVLVGFFIVYLFAIQVIDIKNLRIKAKNQRKAYSFVMRGNIFDRNGIKLSGVNTSPGQKLWTDSPKVYASHYIDDAAVGTPMITLSNGEKCVAWLKIKKLIIGE